MHAGALMSVEEVASQLGLHPRTVRGYIRAGRLPATRIGKQYRIDSADFAALARPARPERGTGAEALEAGVLVAGLLGAEAVQGPPVADVTSVLLVDRLSRTAADRLLTLLSATARGFGVRVDLGLTHTAGQLKVVVSGSLSATLDFLAAANHTLAALDSEAPGEHG